ncbi:hypothetical protein FKW77_004336 [Venturia effusa]|uniref:FAD-binding domain-containing protein n=1 Tax=Venturia effusa TaxID=50376 RepID=A0A517LLB3_9PEZI|nr:hypothetical protein FKW77_004336 [Venturia effusa]
MPPALKLKITIIGAGIAGLTAAIALSRQGNIVTVYERRKNTNEQSGSGVQIQPTGVQILKSWGLEDELRKVAHESGEIKLRRWQNGEVIAVQSRRGQRGQWWGMRNDLRRFLYHAAVASGAVVHFGRKAKSVDLDTPAVTFDDGTNSAVRTAIHPNAKSKVLDQCVFQAQIPREAMYESQDTKELYDDPATHLWLGQDLFGLSSVSPVQSLYDFQLGFVNYTNKDDPNPAQLLESLTEAKYVNEQLSGWNLMVRSLFKKANKHLKWRIVEAPRLDTAGSSMGIEDAAVLAELLTHAVAIENVPHLTKCYDRARHARIEKVREYSDFMGKMMSYPDGKNQQHRDQMLRSFDPNQSLNAAPSMTAHYGSAEWMTWLDVFDVKETVKLALENAVDKERAKL